MNKKTKKIIIFGTIIAAIIIITYLMLHKPYYPDIYTPTPIIGNPNSSIHVVMYEDLECPACAQSFTIILRLEKEYADNISFEFKHFPLTSGSFHQYAYHAAEAAECANDQGRFYDYITDCYLNQEKLKDSDLKDRAKALGLDTKKFNSCLDSGKKKQIVDMDIADGKQINVHYTPTIYINDVEITKWQYANFKKELDLCF